MSGTNETSPSLSRRRFLQSGLGGLAAAGVTRGTAFAAGSASTGTGRAKRLIFILCTGGPSQLDTWDPKPHAPAEIRGPYRAIPTSVTGIQFAETLPRLARLAEHFAVVRSVHSDVPAFHEAGLQAVQTGRYVDQGTPWPHLGAVLASRTVADLAVPSFVTLPRPLLDTGLPGPRGEGAGFLGAQCAPAYLTAEPGEGNLAFRSQDLAEITAADLCSVGVAIPTAGASNPALDLKLESRTVRDRYGRHRFGDSLLTARRLLEAGSRCVIVNQFDNLFHQHTWDCHGYPDLPTRVSDLRDEVAAPFDQGVSALIEDLQARGLYEETVICCFGEFGRTPQITETGGRDHHTGCWSVMLGGGGIHGGQVIGASDAVGAEPVERPVTPAMLAATVYAALGVPLDASLESADGKRLPLLPAGTRPIHELLGVG